MSSIVAIISVGAVAGAAISADASRKAAHTQVDAQNKALAVEQDTVNKQLALEKPFVDAGVKALPTLEAGVAPGGQFNKPYTLADYQAGPQAGLFKFEKDQATESIENQLNKMGLGGSTNAVGDVGKLTTDLANRSYNTGFNQNMAQNQFTLDSLAKVLGIGTNAAAGTVNVLGADATAKATGLTNIGNAQAGGIIGQGNAIGGAVSSIGQDAATAYMLKNYFTKPGTTGVKSNAYADMAAQAPPAQEPNTLATQFS